MHLTRTQIQRSLPLPRKGTKYVARALSHTNSSVAVVIALRDMLKLAKTASEVRKMIKQNLLKINGKTVRDYRESIRLLNILHADKDYVLTYTTTGKFQFQEAKNLKHRTCKVLSRKLISKDTLQLNLHDGSNILTKDKSIKVNDSVYLDLENTFVKHIMLEKGKEVLISKGKYLGHLGTVESIAEDKVNVKFKDKSAELNKSSVIVL